MKIPTQKFDSDLWDKIPAKFLEKIASRYSDLPRMSSKDLYQIKTK